MAATSEPEAETEISAVAEAEVPATANGELATNDRLQKLTLNQLKKLGNVWGVPQKYRRTKGEIIPQLIGRVTTAEVSQI